MLTKKQVAQGNPHFPGRKHGKINCGYDDVGERNRRRTVHQKGNFYGIWRNTFLGIPMLCTGNIPLSECANLYFIWRKDNLTSIETISEFAGRIGASLTVMKDGEHWFHTEEQMEFLDDWLRNIKEIKSGLNIL